MSRAAYASPQEITDGTGGSFARDDRIGNLARGDRVGIVFATMDRNFIRGGEIGLS